MGFAKLNIWISAPDDPCGIDDIHRWYVTIYNCDGNVLEWCNKRYVVLPAPCGHLEVDVPPGVYYLKAVWSYRYVRGIYYVNHFTDAAIVQAVCDQTTCVKLFNPTLHRCGVILLRAVKDLLNIKKIRPELVKRHEAALQEVLADIPKPVKAFELAHLDEIDKLVEEGDRKTRQ